ncbi:hypothetical protein SACS_0834 [Parasaccharibacter apium]|uniref:Uncharacterized protein n=1 Tax=Parasaccharibacter apium TaxID=1510841 RepID=A0A7U7G5K2_9PROT|nr:hypothetical protein SACS_0834 [Parasaccharibacter apium]
MQFHGVLSKPRLSIQSCSLSNPGSKGEGMVISGQITLKKCSLNAD